MNIQEIILGIIASLISGMKAIFVALKGILPQGLIGDGIILAAAFLLGYYFKVWILNPKTKLYWVTIALGLIIYFLIKLGMA